jgi:hypothetical protein
MKMSDYDRIKRKHDHSGRMFAKSYPVRSICEVLREIYWETKDPEIRRKLDEATVMAKKISRKLVGYKEDALSDLYEDVPNVEELTKERLRMFRKEQAEIDANEAKRIKEHEEKKGAAK